MAYNRQIPKINKDTKRATQWFRLYLEQLTDDANNLSSSSVSTSSNTITSSTGTLRFSSSGIINFNGLKIDFTANNGVGVLASNSATYASFQPLEWLGHKPGEIIATLRSTAPTGWILAQDGTIGNESSGASVRAHQDCEALYVKLWNKYDNDTLAVTGGRGTSGVNDFVAGKPIALPTITSRVVACSGSGSGLTVRTDYELAGSTTHTITEAEMASHWHTPLQEPASGTQFAGAMTYWGFDNGYNRTFRTDLSTQDDLEGAGLGTAARSNIEKTQYLNFIIKL